MAESKSQPIFVGRHAELEQFDEVLAAPEGQAIVVVGQRGMGKTMLINRMADQARRTPNLKCGTVRYEVTPTDTVDATMALMLDHAFEAAQTVARSLDFTEQRVKQWHALIKLLPKGGELVELRDSLRRDPQRNTRDQFVERLHLISKRMAHDARALFFIDPEKYMQPDSADAWRLLVRQLPDKVKFIFAQRPEDVLVSNSDFMALENMVRIPEERLDILDEQAVEELLTIRMPQLKVPIGRVREAIQRYDGHPYAIPAALDLIQDGQAIEDLPADPTPERVAEAQWQHVCDKHGKEAMHLLEAYAVLEVAVPVEVAEAVSSLEPAARRSLLANPYIEGLLRDEPDGRRLYHSLLSDHISTQLSKQEAEAYHRRAIDEYRRRLTAEVNPDALSAVRLSEHVLAAEGEAAFVKSFVDECTGPLFTLGLLDAALGLSHRALNDIVSPGTVEEAVVAGNLGLIYRTRGDLDPAEDMHQKALEINEKLGRLEGMASQYGNLGAIYQTRGDLDQAEDMHQKSLKIEKKLGRLEGMASEYSNLGVIYRRRGDLDQAEAMHRKSLNIFEKLGRFEGMAIQYGNLGAIYQTRGDLDQAEDMHQKSLEIGKKLGNPEVMANQYGNLGLIYLGRGDLEAARQHWTEARDLFERAQMPHMVKKVQGWIDKLP